MNNKIAIVLPCFNEEKRLSPHSIITEITSFSQIDFIFVNDGSTDNTQGILEYLSTKKENIKVHNLPLNVGKAEAVRSGILKANDNIHYSHVGYMDADFATPFNQLNLFLNHLRYNQKHQILFGSRIKRAGATIERSQLRHYSGRVMATIVNNTIIKIPVYDTQCGAKVMDVTLAKELFKEPFISKWLFDIELIARLQETRPLEEVLEMVYEVPLTVWQEKGKTKITFKDVLQVPFQLLRIHRKYKPSKAITQFKQKN